MKLIGEAPKRQYRRPAILKRIGELSASTQNPICIICIVVEARNGLALVQDIMDTPGKQAAIYIDTDGQLAIAEKYVLIGDVRMITGPDGKELRMIVSTSHNVNGLDIKLYKEALKSTESLNREFVG